MYQAGPRKNRMFCEVAFFVFGEVWISFWWLLLPLAVFAALVAVHARVVERLQRSRRAIQFYERGVARLENRWKGTGEAGERLNLLRLVDRAHFGGLGNRDDAGLGVVFVADTVVGVADRRQRDLAVLMGQWDQLAAGVLLRRATFVGVDVSIVAAQDRLKRPSQSLQAQNIGAGPVEGEKDCNVGAKMLLELLHSRMGVSIIAVGLYMALVGAGNGFENLGMNAGIVVAGEAAGRRGGHRNHIE